MSVRRLLGFSLSLVVACFGLAGTPAANAAGNCPVNVGSSNCGTNGSCEVNVDGNCDGDCTVNVAATCGTGATCFVNVLSVCSADVPASDVVAVEGSGTITPALPCTGCVINFNFTAIVAGDEAGAYTGCQFNGTSTGLEDETMGRGSGTLGGCAAAGTVAYIRTGPLVQVSGKVTVNGVCHDILESALVFVPTSQPVTTFIVTGAVVLGDGTGC